MNIVSWYRTVLSVLVFLVIFVSPVEAQESSEQPVFREITFGDSQRTVRQKVLSDTFFDAPMVNLGDEALSPEGNVDLRIEETPLDLVFFFNRRGFYRLDASTTMVPEDKFDSPLRTHLDRLRSSMESRYGDPSLTQRQEPGDVAPGDFVTVDYWDSKDIDPNRTIWVGISAQDSGYKASLIIQDPSRTDAGSYQLSVEVPKVSLDEASNHF